MSTPDRRSSSVAEEPLSIRSDISDVSRPRSSSAGSPARGGSPGSRATTLITVVHPSPTASPSNNDSLKLSTSESLRRSFSIRDGARSLTPPLPGFSEPTSPGLNPATPKSQSRMYGNSVSYNPSVAYGQSSHGGTPNRSSAGPPPPPSPLQFHLAEPLPEGEEPHLADGKPVDADSLRKSKIVLGLLVVLKLLTSYDGGAFSVVLGADDGLAEELGLSPSESGTLSSSVFLGNLAGCIVAGNMFSKYSAKRVMLLGMLAHALFTFLFGFSYNFEYAVACRFMIGITLAFPVVYSPVWVEAFGPQDRATTWMALCNAGVPIGIMLGFVIGGLVPAHTNMDWRWIFFSKAVFMLPILLLMHRVDRKSIDTDASTKNCTAEGNESIKQAIVRLFKILMQFCKNALYFNNVAALCCLYFVITALQTFITPYLRAPPFNAGMNAIVIGFGGTVVTAPVVGVIGGGVLIDKLGGYHENVAQAMTVQALWGFGAFIFSLITIMTTNVLGFLVSMWCLLCLGGAIVPVATGVLMASVEEEHRSAASSVSAMCFNLFGYFSGPLFCGMVTDATGSLTWGIRITFLCSGIGCIPMTYAVFVARKRKHLHAHTSSYTNSDAATDEFSLRKPDATHEVQPPPPLHESLDPSQRNRTPRNTIALAIPSNQLNNDSLAGHSVSYVLPPSVTTPRGGAQTPPAPGSRGSRESSPAARPHEA